jgi:hypothetical protein
MAAYSASERLGPVSPWFPTWGMQQDAEIRHYARLFRVGGP